jgi:hypothetical protein
MEIQMSKGPDFLKFVEELRNIGFPVEAVSGGDIHKVWMMKLTIKEAILELHGVAEHRRRSKQLNNMQ